MYWYKFELSEEQVRKGEWERAQKEFTDYFLVTSAWKEGVYLFSQTIWPETKVTFFICSKSELHGKILSRLLSAVPCDPPDISSLGNFMDMSSLKALVGDGRFLDEIKRSAQ
jgi:hypothetical protein